MNLGVYNRFDPRNHPNGTGPPEESARGARTPTNGPNSVENTNKAFISTIVYGA